MYSAPLQLKKKVGKENGTLMAAPFCGRSLRFLCGHSAAVHLLSLPDVFTSPTMKKATDVVRELGAIWTGAKYIRFRKRPTRRKGVCSFGGESWI